MTRYTIDFLPEYTDEALLDELRRIAALLSPGEPLAKTALKQHSPKVSENTLRRRFDGWKEALAKAGLGHLYHGQPVSQTMKEQPARTLSNDGLIAEVKRVHTLSLREKPRYAPEHCASCRSRPTRSHRRKDHVGESSNALPRLQPR